MSISPTRIWVPSSSLDAHVYHRAWRILTIQISLHLPWQVTTKSTRESSGCGPGIRTSVTWMMLTSRMPSKGTMPRRKTHQNTHCKPNHFLTNQKAKQNEHSLSPCQTWEAIPEFGYMSRQRFQSQTELFFSPSLTFIPGSCVYVRRQMTLEEGRPIHCVLC